jgi:hemin uptake protein HemP
MPDDGKHPRPEPETDPQPAPRIDARELFRGEREICLEFEGQRYRLRITRRNKLILQK